MKVDMQKADDQSRAALAAVRAGVDEKLAGKSTQANATVLGYTTQVVSGTNFFLKVQFGDALYAHIRVWRGFQGEHELHSVQVKQKDDPLEYFETDAGLPEAVEKKEPEAGRGMVCGGMRPGMQDADDDSRKALEAVRGNVDAKLAGASAAKTATILGYTTQVVAGTNFFMKVQFGDALYAHLRIWRGFQGEHELHSVQVKQKDDSLDYFENDKDLPEPKQEEKKEADLPKPWLGSLITGTAQEGWALAVKMSRMGVKTTQPNVEILHKVRPAYSEDATNLIACSQVIALNFQTIAAVNNYWKK